MTKPPIEYASRPPKVLGRRSRRLRREAFKLLIMAGVLGTATAGYLAYGIANVGDDRGDHSSIYAATALAVVTAIFALAAAMRYLESRSGD